MTDNPSPSHTQQQNTEAQHTKTNSQKLLKQQPKHHSCSPPPAHMGKKYSPNNSTFQGKRNSLSSIPNNGSPLGMNQIIVSSSSTSSFSGFPKQAPLESAQTSSGFFLSNTKLSSYLSTHQQPHPMNPSKVNLTFSRPVANTPSPEWQTASTLSNQLKRTHNTSSTITALSSQPSGSFL